MSRSRLRAATALALLLTLGPAWAEPAATRIDAQGIGQFRIGSAETRFGALDYLGGFSYRSNDQRLEGVSAIRMQEGGRRFLTVTDTGYWFRGAIRRDASGRPVGMDDARIDPILDASGAPPRRKGEADAEGLALDGDSALVSFERDARIERFDAARPGRPTAVPLPIPKRELRSNGGLETIAVSPKSSPLEGAAIVVAEQSIDGAGNLLAAILGRGDAGQFTVRKDKVWSATDGAFLPGGDFLLLERRYEGFGRIGMRIRRIAAAAIRPGALVDGPVIMEADFGNEIDNMEGLDVWTNERGETILSLVSDDNGSFFQRNLYLEFRLREGAQAGRTP
ncbi:esterase-like activity of phytase family protein [Aureimonas ureilytica]|uniref:esterase-like activity of phytase family protein n=1 Tax=Aureimonas ureilytica TaxID=401562 RepID=UPI003CECF62F